MKVLVTGGAGFIGSHLVDRLMEKGHKIKVFDNVSSGKLENLKTWTGSKNFELVKGDLLVPREIKSAIKDYHYVYHLAANPEVNVNKASPEDHFKQNITATYNLLESIRKSKNVNGLGFASSSTVYGEVNIYPTPEEYGPLIPISLYGASKLACEALITAYSSMYGFNSCIFRLANIVGPRSNHGVIYDFIKKLEKNPSMLEVLGDGTQSKSYLYVSDCIEGLLKSMNIKERVSIFNIGSEDKINVIEIAQIVLEETENTDAEIKLSGGIDGGRGWKGDVKIMQLDMKKLKEKDWQPRYNSSEAVRLTAKAIYTGNKTLLKLLD